jgi:hypothetical protein
MYLTKRFNPKASTFRKDRKYEERNKSKKVMKPLPPVLEEKHVPDIPVNPLYQLFINYYNFVAEEQPVVEEEPVVSIKKKYKNGKRKTITKDALEKFKLDRRFNLFFSNAGDKILNLPETLIESILEFSGLISTHKDYKLIKFGFHESERKTHKLIKEWIIKQLNTCSNERFITIIEYFKTIPFSKQLNENIVRFLHQLEYLYDTYDGNELLSDIDTLIWCERRDWRSRKSRPRLIQSIIAEPPRNFNRQLVDNMP